MKSLAIENRNMLQKDCVSQMDRDRVLQKFSKIAIDVYIFELTFIFAFFVTLSCVSHLPFGLLLFGKTRYDIPENIRALAGSVFKESAVTHVPSHDEPCGYPCCTAC